MSTEGLRERRRRRTRAALHKAALDLFARQGFDATTIAQIAAAAEVAPRTFFGYFRAKEDVVFAEFEDEVTDLERALETGQQGESDALDILRVWIEHYVDEHPLDDERERLIDRIAKEHAAVAARELQLLARIEVALARALASGLRASPADLRPRLVAAAAVATLRALYEVGRAEPGSAASSPDDPLGRLDEALTFLRAGLAALQPEPTAADGPERGWT